MPHHAITSLVVDTQIQTVYRKQNQFLETVWRFITANVMRDMTNSDNIFLYSNVIYVADTISASHWLHSILDRGIPNIFI